jgi:hypothetical protein
LVTTFPTSYYMVILFSLVTTWFACERAVPSTKY